MCSVMKEVGRDEVLADREFGPGLRTGPLLGGIAVGIVLSFEDPPRAGQPRCDKFLAHLMEGHMKETFEYLQEQVEEAKRKHRVKKTEVWLCYRDVSSLRDDKEMIWNSQMIYAEYELVENFIEMTKGLSSYVQLHAHHVLREQDMCITKDGRIRIRKLEKDADQ
ncbi:hypothetical protein INS49_001346 [Diaporthe citri]|uniref:uncharacterized protein n=1 Tax=Diaporthe citri TaxID=83186 RepID=UPI001C7F3E75|nr:uncharacterized protein INS49_001346 [Diaporthe citri]KAG6367162.1 hypothetical protein INS49_001346 [Diaporthe citri]